VEVDMRSRAVRAREVTTDDYVVIHDPKERDKKFKVCEVYKNRKIVKITYLDEADETGHKFKMIKAKPMHRVRIV